MGKSLSNPGYDNKWTCPNCYHDFDERKATSCPNCNVAIHCRIEQQPVCVCELGTEEED